MLTKDQVYLWTHTGASAIIDYGFIPSTNAFIKLNNIIDIQAKYAFFAVRMAIIHITIN